MCTLEYICSLYLAITLQHTYSCDKPELKQQTLGKMKTIDGTTKTWEVYDDKHDDPKPHTLVE